MGMKAGTIEPPKIEHLIVDEYQDLNPMDIEFVDSIVEAGSKCFLQGTMTRVSIPFQIRRSIRNSSASREISITH